MPVFTSACPRNCYSTCGLRVTVEEGRLKAIEPHPDNRATGTGVCLKGLSYVERVHSPRRLRQPLAKRDGAFVPVSWDEALDRMASEFTRIKETWGAQAILHYSASGTKGLLNGVGGAFWRLFGGCTTTYGDLCWPAGLEATRLTLGDSLHNAPWLMEKAGLIIMWGKNPAETNVHEMDHLARAVAQGAKVIVIDPRRTETADRADLHLQPRPGTDGALALAFAGALIQRGAIDSSFIEAHVQGFDAFASLAAAWPLSRAAETCGIPLRLLEAAVALLSETRPFLLVAGFGMQRYSNGGQTMRALLALPVITGQIGLPGGGFQYANLATQVFGHVKDPLECYPPEVPDGVVRVGLSTARLGRDMLALTDPPMKAAFVERGNPIPQNPETPRVLEAFRALEFRVVVDEVLTDTAQEADLVLPAKTFFEQTDVIGAYWHPYLQLRPKLLDPPGEVKPETELYWLLAERLGMDPAAMEAALVRPGTEEAWLRRKLAPWPDITLERLAEGPVLAPGAMEVPFADRRFPTPSRRIELWSDEARTRWGLSELPAWSEPVESQASPEAAQYPLVLLTPNTKNRIHSQFGFLDAIRPMEPLPLLSLHPKDAQVRGLQHGDQARVFNARGELTLQVKLDAGLKPGVASIPNGFWRHEGAVNQLSQGRETDMGHGAAFHDNLVQVEAVR